MIKFDFVTFQYHSVNNTIKLTVIAKVIIEHLKNRKRIPSIRWL